MYETSASLLDRLRERPDPRSWERLFELYAPWVGGWLRRQGISHQDAEDLVQDVMAVVVRELPRFHYDPAIGSFRGWLRTITANRLRAFQRNRGVRRETICAPDFSDLLNQLEDPASSVSQLWNQEHDRHIVATLLALVEPEFEPTTWKAFCKVALEGRKPAEVATELGVAVNAVFIAKSRVLRRLREETAGL